MDDACEEYGHKFDREGRCDDCGAFESDCGSGQCDPNTGCPACSDPPQGGWHRRS